jgi:nicotinamidase-related amidase
MQKPSEPPRHLELLSANRSRLVLVDLQEKLLPAIEGSARIVARCERLLAAAGIFDVPVSATEQYPHGLRPTVEPLRRRLAEISKIPEIPEKLRFSGAASLDWAVPGVAPAERDQIILAGIETHVCILQSAFDLAAGGFRVYVPVDAVGSRFSEDRETALRRLEAAGITLVTTESVLFEWCEVAGTDRFKQISRLVRENE